jgi:hypothetical protein
MHSAVLHTLLKLDADLLQIKIYNKYTDAKLITLHT